MDVLRRIIVGKLQASVQLKKHSLIRTERQPYVYDAPLSVGIGLC